VDALEKREIPFLLWSPTPVKRKSLKIPPLVQPFDTLFEASTLSPPITHIIAGTESAVYPASLLRRTLGARSSPTTLIRQCHDKLEMKRYLRQHTIPMTHFLEENPSKSAERYFKELGSPIVIKERTLSGGRGIKLVSSAEEFNRLRGRSKIYEAFIQGNEMSVETFIQDGEIKFLNQTQYYVKGSVNLTPAHLPPMLTSQLFELNRRIIRALKIEWGVTHVEFYSTKNGPLFGEIAVRPPGGYIMELLKLAYRFDPWDALIQMELGNSYPFPTQAQKWAASYVIHPGAGLLEEIKGWDEIQKLSSVKHARMKAKPGNSIQNRHGLGEEIGHILFCNPDREVLIKDVDRTLELLQFKMRA